MTDQNWFSETAATFGDRVAAAREAKGYSQADLARRIGVRKDTVEHWENDITEPRANKLQMLAGLLNVSIRWLLTGEGEGPESDINQTVEIAQALDEVRRLRTEMLRAAERLGRLEKALRRDREEELAD